MKVVGLVDSFKNSFTSSEASDSIRKALTFENVDAFPVSDGGENTVDNLINLYGGVRVSSIIKGPSGKEIQSYFGYVDSTQTAIIESAEGAGIQKIIVGEHSLMELSSFGVGQQILHALDLGVKTIIIGLGGTATIDGGLGLLNALGVEFYDENLNPVDPYNYSLGDVTKISIENLDTRIKDTKFVLASDVDNPLIGHKGAVRTFGLQKGLVEELFKKYEMGLINYAEVLSKTTKTNHIDSKHTGAAGGIGFALMCITNCEWIQGYNLFLNHPDVIAAVKHADYVITGEGRFDEQSLNGKLISGVIKLAGKYQRPVIVICGTKSKTVKTNEIHTLIELSHFAKDMDDSIKNGLEYFSVAMESWYKNIVDD